MTKDMTGRLSTPEAITKFMLAGNAYVTIRSEKTDVRYTFRVSKAKKEEGNNWKELWFVALLAGPENTSDYVYMGTIRDGVFRLTRASKVTEESKPVLAFHWVFDRAIKGVMPAKVEVWHEGRCGRCGRTLTVPESIAAGLGPECAGRVGA